MGVGDPYNPVVSTDDFSLDPLEMEKAQIAQQIALAQAQALRRGTGRGPTVGDIGTDSIVDSAANNAQFQMASLRNQQSALSEKYQVSLNNALAEAPDYIKAMINNPSTRAQGLKLFERIKSDQLSQDRYNTFMDQEAARERKAQGGAQGGALPNAIGAQGGSQNQFTTTPSRIRGEAFMGGNDPAFAALSKADQEMYMKEYDPLKMREGKQGPFMPEANRAVANEQELRKAAGLALAHPTLIAGENQAGDTTQTPAWAIAERYSNFNPGKILNPQNQGGPSQAPQAGPPQAGPPVPPPPTPTQPPSGGGGLSAGMHPLVQFTPILETYDPNNPVNSKTGAAGPYQIMPKNVAEYSQRAGRQLDPMNPQDGAMMSNAVWQDAAKRYPGNELAQVAYYNGGYVQGDLVAAGKRPNNPETRQYLGNYAVLKSQLNAQAQQQGGPPQNQPPPGPPQVPQVGPPQGQLPPQAQPSAPQALPNAVGAQPPPAPPPQGPAMPGVAAALSPVGSAQAAPPQGQPGAPPPPDAPTAVRAQYELDKMPNAKVVRGPMGEFGNKWEAAHYAEQRSALDKQAAEINDQSMAVNNAYTTAQQIKQLMQKPFNSGKWETDIQKIQENANSKDPEIANTAAINKLSMNLAFSVTKAMSNRATNLDLHGAMEQVPNTKVMTEATVKMLTDILLHSGERDMEKLQFLSGASRQGYDLSASQNAWTKANTQTEAKLASGRPGTAAPNPLPPGMQNPDYKPGVAGQPGMPQGRMTVGSNSAGPTWDAVKDAATNTWEGGKNAFGFGNRALTNSVKAEQDARRESEPAYDKARTIIDVGKYLPALAAGPWGAALINAGIATAQPAETLPKQLIHGAEVGASSVIPGGAAARAATVAAGRARMAELGEVMGNSRAGSAAYRAARNEYAEIESGLIESGVGPTMRRWAEKGIEAAKSPAAANLGTYGIPAAILAYALRRGESAPQGAPHAP